MPGAVAFAAERATALATASLLRWTTRSGPARVPLQFEGGAPLGCDRRSPLLAAEGSVSKQGRLSHSRPSGHRVDGPAGFPEGRRGTVPARTVGSSPCGSYAAGRGQRCVSDLEQNRASGRRVERPHGRRDRDRRGEATLATADRPAFVVVRASRRRLHGPCSARVGGKTRRRIPEAVHRPTLRCACRA